MKTGHFLHSFYTFNMAEQGFSTKALWAGCDPEQFAAWDVMPPISPSTIFKQVAPGKFKRFDYSRFGNPTRAVLQEALAKLDGGEYGLVYSSGLASIVAVFNLLSAGDNIVLSDDLYPGTMTYLTQVAIRMKIESTFVDVSNTENIAKAVKSNTKMIFVETATNPKLKVPDIKAIVALARKKNPEILVVVDNTFLTPYFVKPLELGADIAVMSLSKYMNGHHDVIMGAVVVKRQDLHKRLFFLQKNLGAIPAANDCYQVVRSIKTLPLRMERHMQNGLAVAKYLESHSKITNLRHPLLDSHPQNQLAKSQNKGHSGMISFNVVGTGENAAKFLMSLKVILLATSLGGTVSTIGLPGSMTTDELDESFIKMRDLPDTFVRLSVGLEDEKDLLEDLKQALEKAYST